ncbi:helix-turn-helix transcriptional regulator [Allofournierella massiliensis]
MKFNEKLVELRKRQGLSQEQLGMELQVSRQTVSKWEAGVSHN